MNSDKWLNYCLDMARKIPYRSREARVYAVVVDRKGKLVSESGNSYKKTHPKQAELAKKVGLPEKIFGHAELLALQKDRDKRGRRLIVGRVDSKGRSCYACPCPICSEAIQQHGGIESVNFSV